MNRMIFSWMLVALVFAISPLSAQEEEEKKPWSNTTDLSAVVTGGNAETRTFGFKNDYLYAWDNAQFTFFLGAIFAEKTTTTRTAVGIASDFQVIEVDDTETTDEKYFGKLKYQRNISKKVFWFSGLDWDSNEFAGIDNRYTFAAGVGNIWIDREDRKFTTDYGVTYTKEDLVAEPPDFDDAYGGFKATYAFFTKVGTNSEFKQDFQLYSNLEESEDWRLDLNNAFTTSVSERVALKIGLQMLYDNLPALEAVTLTANGIGTGEVFLELDELDTIFTVSLVIRY